MHFMAVKSMAEEFNWGLPKSNPAQSGKDYSDKALFTYTH